MTIVLSVDPTHSESAAASSGIKANVEELCAQIPNEVCSMCDSLQNEEKKCNFQMWFMVENSSTKSVPSRRSHMTARKNEKQGWFSGILGLVLPE